MDANPCFQSFKPVIYPTELGSVVVKFSIHKRIAIKQPKLQRLASNSQHHIFSGASAS